MKKQSYIFTLIVSSILLAQGLHAQTQKVRKPNIIFILADDLGYGDVSAYNPNSPLVTPHIDQLAAEGIKYTRFYAGNTVCAPSRCALMTGRHMGTAFVRGNAKAKDGKGALREKDITIAEILQDEGYTTGMFGKWGLGDAESRGAPHLKGFDNFYGYLDQSHAHNYYTDSLYEIRSGKTEMVKVNHADYTQDLIANKALTFIKENKDNPFFLYLPFTLPHAELVVPDSLRKAFQKEDGSSRFEPETPYVKKGSYGNQVQPHAAFAAMVNKLDTDVGRVVDLIKSLGLEDDTYIFFSSDNGPHHEGGADPEFFNSSGPLRGIKRDLYEGGIRVPFIAKVPGNANAGSQVDDPWAFWDLLPTFTDIANLHAPKNINGLSFQASLNGLQSQTKHTNFYWQFNEQGVLKQAISGAKWKLIRFKEEGKPERLELYNLSSDIGEKNNVAAQNPRIVNELSTQLKKENKKPENPTFDWSYMEN